MHFSIWTYLKGNQATFKMFIVSKVGNRLALSGVELIDSTDECVEKNLGFYMLHQKVSYKFYIFNAEKCIGKMTLKWMRNEKLGFSSRLLK